MRPVTLSKSVTQTRPGLAATSFRQNRCGSIRAPAARSRFRSRGCLLPFLALALALLRIPLSAQSNPALVEHQLKAVFLLNFARFVEWPENAFQHGKAPFVIKIIGPSPIATLLEKALQGETYKHRTFLLLVQEMENFNPSEPCHLLFVSRAAKDRVPSLLKQTSGSPVLLVSEVEGFIEAGGMINFVIANKNLVFEVNPAAAQKARLKMSSKLLSLPKAILKTPPQ